MSRRRPAPSGVVIAALGAVAVATAMVPRDAAAVPPGVRPNYLRDFQTVQAQSSASTVAAKTVVSSCPAGKIALGTGGSTLGFPGFPSLLTSLGLQRMRVPSGPGPGTLVSAVAADPDRARWLLGMQTQCAAVTSASPGLKTGGPYVKEVTVVRAESAVNSDSPKQLTVSCGAGKQSIGGGFANGLGSGVVAVSQALRVEGGFRVRVQETDPTTKVWQTHVVAICANLARPGQAYIADVSVRESVTDFSSRDFKADVVDCPQGQRAIGGGAEILGSSESAPPPRDVTLVASGPAAGSGRIPDGWHAAAGEEDLTAASWRIRLRAICGTVVTPTLDPTVSPG